MRLLRLLSPNGLLAVAGAALVWLMLTGNVLAAEHGQTNSAFDESPLPFLFAVYTITWAAFFGYVFLMSRRQREMQGEIEALTLALQERERREVEAEAKADATHG